MTSRNARAHAGERQERWHQPLGGKPLQLRMTEEAPHFPAAKRTRLRVAPDVPRATGTRQKTRQPHAPIVPEMRGRRYLMDTQACGRIRTHKAARGDEKHDVDESHEGRPRASPAR